MRCDSKQDCCRAQLSYGTLLWLFAGGGGAVLLLLLPLTLGSPPQRW